MNLKLIIPVHFETTLVQSDFEKRLEKTLQPVLHTDTRLSMEALPNGATASIESRSDLWHNAGYVLDIAKRAECEGADGVYVTDMDMCGVEIAREHLRVPIIGGFTASVYSALALSRRFSIITILDSVVDMQIEHIAAQGLLDRFASIRVANAPVSELIEAPEQTVERVFEQSLRAVIDDGAQAIVLGCTGFIDIASRVAKQLCARGIDVPVCDPNRTAVSFLQHLVSTRLHQSKQTYRRPRHRGEPISETNARPAAAS